MVALPAPKVASSSAACPCGCSMALLGRPSAGGRRTAGFARNWRSPSPGCPSVGGQRTKRRAPPRCSVVAHRPRRVGCAAMKDTTVFRTNGFELECAVRPIEARREGGTHMRQSFQSLAACGTAPLGGKATQASGRFGIKAVRGSGVAYRPEQLFIAAGPNPSIEGTSTSGLRPLAAAPHVKR